MVDVAGKADTKMALLIIKGITRKESKSIGLVKLDLSEYVFNEGRNLDMELPLMRCLDKSATVNLRVKATRIRMNPDDEVKSIGLSSVDMKSVESNPHSDFDLEDLDADTGENDDSRSITSKTHLRKLKKKTPRNDSTLRSL